MSSIALSFLLFRILILSSRVIRFHLLYIGLQRHTWREADRPCWLYFAVKICNVTLEQREFTELIHLQLAVLKDSGGCFFKKEIYDKPNVFYLKTCFFCNFANDFKERQLALKPIVLVARVVYNVIFRVLQSLSQPF